MKITCPSCSAKYSIADEKVADRLAKIRCRKCGTTIVIDGKVDPANVYAADAAPEAGPGPASAGAAAAGEYSVDFGDNDQRNMTLDQLVTSYNAGEVTAETYIWTEGMDDWRPLGEVDDVVNALHAASSESGGSAPMVSAPSSPFDTGASASPWANDNAPKAATSAGTADLFGGFDSAGSEEDVTTSAPEEARGPAAAATGARNESSVLFSLSALTSAAEKQPEPLGGMAASSGSMKEDSGLIDLKALTSQASADQAADNPLMGGSPLGFGAPLGLGSPLMGGIESSVPASASMAPQPKSRSGLYIGGGIALAAVVIAGAIVFASGGKETGAAAQPEGATTAAATTAAPTAEPTPTAAVTAEAPATGTATAEEPAPSAEPVAAAQRPANYGKPLPKPAATAAKPAATGTPAAKPTATAAPKPTAKPPTKKPCACPPGDLMCAMRCRAG